MHNNHSHPKIMMIYTGGTIGMRENPVTKALEPFDFDHLIDLSLIHISEPTRPY